MAQRRRVARLSRAGARKGGRWAPAAAAAAVPAAAAPLSPREEPGGNEHCCRPASAGRTGGRRPRRAARAAMGRLRRRGRRARLHQPAQQLSQPLCTALKAVAGPPRGPQSVTPQCPRFIMTSLDPEERRRHPKPPQRGINLPGSPAPPPCGCPPPPPPMPRAADAARCRPPRTAAAPDQPATAAGASAARGAALRASRAECTGCLYPPPPAPLSAPSLEGSPRRRGRQGAGPRPRPKHPAPPPRAACRICSPLPRGAARPRRGGAQAPGAATAAHTAQGTSRADGGVPPAPTPQQGLGMPAGPGHCTGRPPPTHTHTGRCTHAATHLHRMRAGACGAAAKAPRRRPPPRARSRAPRPP
jgi:hypothetical protein